MALPTFKKCGKFMIIFKWENLWKLMAAYWNMDAILYICKLPFIMEWHHINFSCTKEGIKYKLILKHLPILSIDGFFLFEMKALSQDKDFGRDK